MSTNDSAMTRIKWPLVVGGAIGWLLLVLVGYFAVHKPVTDRTLVDIQAGWDVLSRPVNLTSLAGTLVDITATLWILLLAAILGIWILNRLLSQSAGGKFAMLVFGTGLGLGAVSVMTFLLGLAGLWQRELFIGFSLAGVLIIFVKVPLGRWLSDVIHWDPFGRHRIVGLVSGVEVARPSASSRLFEPGQLSRMERVLFGYSLIVLALGFLTALAPPTGWDGLSYHLAAPKAYIEIGRIIPGIDVPHYYFPALVESLFAYAMLLRSDVSAQLLHFSYLVLTAGAVYGLGNRYFGRRVALFSLATILSVPTLIIDGTIAYVDLALVFYITASFWAAINWQTEKRVGWLLLSAVLAGFAMATKYTSAPYVVGLFVVMAVDRLRRFDTGSGARSVDPRSSISTPLLAVVTFTLVSVLVASPWYVKNLFFTGNPFYPFVFEGWNWDNWRSVWYGRPGTGLLAEPLRLLLAPVEATILGIEGGEGYQATIGPLILALVPLLAFIPRNRMVRLCLVFCGVGYIGWLGGLALSDGLQQTRLLLPIFGILSVLAGYALQGLSSLKRPEFDPARVFGSAFCLVLAVTLVSQLFVFVGEMPVGPALGKENIESFLVRRLGDHYRAMSFMNQNLPQHAYVYFLYEPRSYYSQRKSQPDTLLDNWARPLFQYRGADGILAGLKNRGVTHLLVYQGGLDFLLTSQRGEADLSQVEALMDFEGKYLKRLYGSPVEITYVDGKYSLMMAGGALYSLYEIDFPASVKDVRETDGFVLAASGSAS